jgi:hypothetical protein
VPKNHDAPLGSGAYLDRKPMSMVKHESRTHKSSHFVRARIARNHLAGPSNQGWLEALDKLDVTLVHIQAVVTDVDV